MTSGAKTVDLRSKLSEKKRYWGLKKVIRCFFEILLAVILSEIGNRESFQKNRDFLKF